MQRQEAREELKGKLTEYVNTVTRKSKGANMYVCPLCNSGEGKNGTGAFSINSNKTEWKCFSCNAGGDIFDLYGAINATTDYNKQLEELSKLYGLTIEADRSRPEEKHTHNSIHTSVYTQNQPEEETDYTDFFLQAHNNINKTDYPKERGLSKEIIDRFQLGYIEEWKHPKAPKAPTSPRLIIPTSSYSYLARDTRKDIPEQQKGYSKSKVGKIRIFNIDTLKTAQKPVFIVEGEIDALSIIEAGAEAVALGTVGKIRSFLEYLKAEEPEQTLIIALDNDEAGQKATEELIKGLEEQSIKYYKFSPEWEYKDANEALQKNREALIIAVNDAVNEAETTQTEEEKIKKENYLKKSTAHYLQSFIDGITDSVNTPYIPTGFNQLDKVLDGGLYEGLYIVGAISSLGKTTLITQIADQIAESGKDVLIFSLEMARNEIISKSISRNTVKSILENGGDIRNAKTARGITTGSRYANYNDTELELIHNSIKEYEKYAEKIYISEGVGDIGVDQIRNTIKEHTLYTGNIPIVIVDYLQILAPYNERATDKQNTDKAVMELKRISRDYKLPVIGISSFNRANYKEAVTMEAFKESGAIEYSSDVLIGLQLKGAGGANFDANEAKAKNPREIELVILKNRNGQTGGKLSYNYYPMFNYYEEL